MNPTSSYVTTGATALSGAVLGGLVAWLCQVSHLPVPPDTVAGTIGALLLSGGHAFVSWLNNRFPAKVATDVKPAA